MSYDEDEGMEGEMAWEPTAFLRRDTWKTGWIRAMLGSSNLYATSPICSRILNGAKIEGLASHSFFTLGLLGDRGTT